MQATLGGKCSGFGDGALPFVAVLDDSLSCSLARLLAPTALFDSIDKIKCITILKWHRETLARDNTWPFEVLNAVLKLLIGSFVLFCFVSFAAVPRYCQLFLSLSLFFLLCFI